jgi:acyl-CoA synthetase (NDP forming)
VANTVALGKDVVFYKAGRTREGRSATAGHTASVAGNYAVCEAAVSQAGAMVAADFNEFSDLLNLAVHLRGTTVRGNRLVAVSNAGFESVGMADSIRCGAAELHMARLSESTASSLQETLARHRLDRLVDVKNPLDVTPMATDQAYADLVAGILADDGVDVVVAGVVPLTPAMQTLAEGRVPSESIDAPESIARLLPDIARAQSKPVVAVIDSGTWFDPLADRLRAGGLPVFRSADRAVRVLCRFLQLKLRGAQATTRPPGA